ncbi:MAG: GNAT family N-acetyltransferase [Myxococcales bacterium]|nr:GNAT family N-acetyltransferase [Myxococcales bacterium]
MDSNNAPEARLRAADERDYALFARLFLELNTGDETPSEATFRATFLHRMRVFERDGATIGMTIFDKLPEAAYVRIIVIAPEHRARGEGRALMNAIATVLRAEGCKTWRLNVKRDNSAALALYKRMGMRVAYESTAFNLFWSQLDALQTSASAERAVVLAEREDEHVERAWSLPTGQLAQWRARPGNFLLRVERTSDPSDLGAGFVRFEPAFPGAFPLRVREIGSARTLLEACLAQRDLSKDYVRLVVEDNEPFARAMYAAGATTHMELFHMTGSLVSL